MQTYFIGFRPTGGESNTLPGEYPNAQEALDALAELIIDEAELWNVSGEAQPFVDAAAYLRTVTLDDCFTLGPLPNGIAYWALCIR